MTVKQQFHLGRQFRRQACRIFEEEETTGCRVFEAPAVAVVGAAPVPVKVVVPVKVMVPVPVEAQMVADVPAKVTVLVPVEAQEHRWRCQWKCGSTYGGGGADESDGAGESGSTDAGGIRKM